MKNARSIRPLLFVAMFAVAFPALTLPAFAQKTSVQLSSASAIVPARITQAIDERNLVTLSRNTRPEANRMNDRGAVSEGYQVEHMLLELQRSPQQEQAFEKLIDSLNDKKSPNFHKWLTPEQIGQQFGVSDDDIKTLTNWLESQGFRVDHVYANHMVLDISGTAGAIRQGFHTEIHNLEVNGVAHLSNMSDPQIPAALAPVVKGMFSLNDFKPEPMYRVRPDYTFAGCASSTAVPSEPGTCYAITPQDNAVIYSLNPLWNAGISGQGQTIALVEDTDTYGTAGSNGASDWNTYRSTFGLSGFSGTYTQIHPGGCTDPGTNGDDGEAAIDVEVASSIAPSAAIELISCPSATFTFGGVVALQNLINAAGPYPGVVSSSYGLCEAFTGQGGNAFFFNTYQQAAAQGISVFTSSGDEGPSSCSNLFGATGEQYDVASLGVTGWGETPYNVSVGGTDFEDVYNSKTDQNGGAPLSTYWSATNSATFGSALSYIPEMPWDDSCANVLISEVATGSFIPYGASPATCNNATFDVSTSYLSTGAASGGASNCATGAGGTDQGGDGDTLPQCQGYPKPSYQSGSSLTGGQAVYGQPNDGVRDVPDVAMFAANGVWGHFETVCWSDPSQTSGGATSCSGAPSTWAGFGGTSVASPTMAAVQALVNQQTGETWGNPNPIYYQIAQNQYGVAGGSFLGASCNSSTGNTGGCAFNDVTQGDIDLACEHNGAVTASQCYLPTGTHGVDSTDNVTAATVINGGTGYTTAPTCVIAGPTNSSPYLSPTGTTLWAGGTQATCTAAVSSGSTTAVWTVKIGTSGTNLATGAAGAPITVGNTTYTFVTSLTAANQVLVVTSGSTSTQETDAAKNLEAAINANSAQCVTAPCFGSGTVANASATATESTSTVTITAKTAGYAGNFNVVWGSGSGYIEGADIITITNTTPGQGPNYVSGITIGTPGSGYQPDTPITLSGVGSGAIAVANTSLATGAQSYQPAYGAAPGYDLATGLGTPNANALVKSCAWFPLTPGMTTPAPSSTLTGSSATFKWNGFCGSTGYWVDIGSTAGGNNYYSSGNLGVVYSTPVVSGLPTNGSTIYVTLYDQISGSWNANPYTYTAFNAGSETAVMTSPTPNSMLTGSTVMFSWNAGTASPQEYWLDIGSSAGGNNYYSSGNLGSALTTTASGLPTNGTTVYATLYTLVSGTWTPNAYTYTAFNASSATGMVTTPMPGSTLTSSTVTFDWTAGSPGPYSYWMDVGNTAGGNNYYSSGNLGNVTTTTVSGLPTDGSMIYVTLYTLISGSWVGNAYTYTALNSTSGLATMQTPTPGTTISGTTATFNWSGDSNATAYWVDIGSSAGGNDIYSSGNLGTALTTTVTTLPANGSEIYVSLYSYVGGQWVNNPVTYTSGP
jgi:hypothetical protein